MVISYLSNIVSIRVKDELLQDIGMEERRIQTFDGVKATFVGESQERTVVIILEDIHWIDKSSEEFFNYVSSSVAQNRILILALHRPVYQCPWASGSSYLRIPVESLSSGESEEMLHGMLGVGEVTKEVKDLVQGKAREIRYSRRNSSWTSSRAVISAPRGTYAGWWKKKRKRAFPPTSRTS